MRGKDILPYRDDIVAIDINDELQVSFWCNHGRYESNLYLDCKVIDIKIKDGYLSLEVE